MNIFVLSDSPVHAAMYHCDKHVVKMVLETAQMLSTAHRVLDDSQAPMLYKATHINHPCNVWLRESKDNYLWLYQLFCSLSAEYTHRYGRTHLSWWKLHDVLKCAPRNIPKGKMTMFALAMPDEYKCYDPITAYRAYYHSKASQFDMVWTKTQQPYWWLP